MLVSPEVFEQTSPQEKFCNYPLDAVIVLGAFMQKGSHGWKIPTYIESDPGKIVGGHSRAIAVKQLFDEKCASTFIITGGLQKDSTGDVSRAETLAKLITERYKVPEEHVVAITTVGNTLGNLNDTILYLEDHKEIYKKRRIGVLSNEWHIPRSMIFFENNPYFSENGIELFEISAEDVLTRRSEKYARWIEKVRGSGAMHIRIQMEAQGIEAYFAGNYQPLNA